MSLNYDLTKISDLSDYPDNADGSMNGITQTIIFGTMITGIGNLTDESAPEFWARLHMVEQLRGPLVYAGGEPRPITRDDINAHVGLTTNVFPKETRATWIKRNITSQLTDYAREYSRP